MHVPSLSSGCEIAQFFVRYIAQIFVWGAYSLKKKTNDNELSV
jgi:hypothetical protein